MRIGISGLAAGNPSGLGRLCRIYILALAKAAPDWELNVFLRSGDDLELITEECDKGSVCLLENLRPHYPPAALQMVTLPGLTRWALEEYCIPRSFAGLKLDAYLGLDFTLPARPVAGVEAVVLPDLLPFTQPGTVSIRARVLYRQGIARSVERNARLLCISRHTQETLKGLFPEYRGDSQVVYPALSPKLWQLAHRQGHGDHPLMVRGSRRNLSDPGPYILSVGVSGKRKNTAQLVDVYSDVVLRGDYRGSLVLVGGDGRYNTLEEKPELVMQTIGSHAPKARQSAEVYDLGRVNDFELSHLYRHADMLVSLSTEEGFGFPVLEALAHGTPALVTKASSMTEITGQGIAKTALDYDECVEKLASALSALPLLRQEAAQFPVADYSIERLGKQLKSALLGDKHD